MARRTHQKIKSEAEQKGERLQYQDRKARRAATMEDRRVGRREAAERRRKQQQRMRMGAILAAVLVVGLGGFFVYSWYEDREASRAPEGVEEFEGLEQGHVQEPVDYDEVPPVGGPHAPVWQNCGFYAAPVNNENAVHSLEHGAVWITYQPDLPQEQVAELRELAEEQTYILVSPYPDLPAPVVASAWGKQLQLESVNDPDLDQFVRAFRQGPQTLEPGASCSGGTSATR